MTLASASQAVEVRPKKGAAVSGQVRDEFGDPAIGVRVAVLTKAGAAKDAKTAATTDTDDRGEYRMVAQIPNEGDGAWQDPQYLESLVPRASTVTVIDGQRAQLTVRLSVP